MRERGWCEAGVTDAQACGFVQGVGADGGVGAGGLGWDVGPDEWCLRRGERL